MKQFSQKRLRLTLVVGVFPALSETFVLDQVIFLLERGHDVHIVAYEIRDEGMAHDEVFQYELLKRTSYLARPNTVAAKLRLVAAALRVADFGLIRTALALIRGRFLNGEVGNFTTLAALIVAFAERQEPDAFLCHFGQNGSLTVRAAEALNWSVPVATIFHGFDLTMLVRRNGQRLYKHLFCKGALFLPACNHFASLLLQMGAPAERVCVQRMCVSLDKLDKIISRLPKDNLPGTLTFIAIGRLVEKKGHLILLSAFQQAFGHLPPGKVRLLIIGDGKLRPEIERATQLNPSIVFLGALPRVEILSWLINADVAVQASITAEDGDMESMPLVISEAMSLRKPVIGTWHSGIPELVLDGITGVLVDERDEASLAGAMVWMLDNVSAARKMGAAGRHRVEERFQASQWNALLETRLRQLRTDVVDG